MIMTGWRHERLVGELGKAMTDVEDSRRRIAEAADEERVRIERNLHDGAQQRLIGLRIRLSIVAELLRCDPQAGVEEVRALGFETERALEELRSLANGVYPALLTDHGLDVALCSVAHRTPMPVSVVSSDVSRHPIEIESAIYFVCVEALQNAMKHATGATGVWIRLSQSTELRVEVRDDGPGFVADQGTHRGLRNMHDRVEAIGGTLTIDAAPGQGTRVVGVVDLA